MSMTMVNFVFTSRDKLGYTTVEFAANLCVNGTRGRKSAEYVEPCSRMTIGWESNLGDPLNFVRGKEISYSFKSSVFFE